MRRHFVSFALLCISAFCASAFADAPGKLVPEADANAAGLTRAWFAQTTLVQGREWVSSATFQDGTLFITTDGGKLQAFDGETGASLWSVNAGEGLLLQPAVNSKLVAAICGTNLLVYDRFTGKKLQETRVYGNPSAPPVMSEREIYVPCFAERVLAYPIQPEEQESDRLDMTINTMSDQSTGLGKASDYWAKRFQEYRDKVNKASYSIKSLDDRRPYPCSSFGVSMVAPIVGTQTYANDYIGWTTDKGWLVFGKMARSSADNPFKLYVKFQVRPNFSYVNESRIGNKALIPRDDVEASPFFMPEDLSVQNMALSPENRQGGMFIVGSESGHVYALNDATGELRWTYLTQTGVSNRISAFGKSAYVPTESGDLYSVDVTTGVENWSAKNVVQTIAASNNRLYVVDTIGRIVSINRTNGERDKILNVGQVEYKVFNRDNDRIYVVSKNGVVQCFHEINAAQPIKHRESCQDIFGKIMSESAKNAPQVEQKRPVAVVDEEEKTETVDPNDDPFADDDASSSNASADDDDDPFGDEDDDASSSNASADEDDDPFGDEDDDASSSNASADDDDDPFGADSSDDEDPFGGDF